MFARLGLQELALAARERDVLLLPHLVPGWHGAALAVLGAALGEGWALLTKAGAVPTAAGTAIGWLALLLILGGLVLQLTRWRQRGGWQVDVLHRRVEPQGLPGQPWVLEPSQGWSLACVAGDRFRSVAIDLRHEERGRVARLFQSPPRLRLRDIRACSELTDALASRLGVGREGLVV